MSRSKHTRPHHILATERVRDPYEPRGRGDRSRQHAQGRLMKRAGVVPDVARVFSASDRSIRVGSPLPLPPIVVKRPGPGHFHPASRHDIEQLLRFFGAEYLYGIRGVVLGRVDAPGQTPVSGRCAGRLALGTLQVPGTIVLYEQPVPPWVLSGRLRAQGEARLARAGAVLELLGHGQQTVVHWPGSTLRDFILFDGLMHEIAHHTLQQYKGKRGARIARTADHEAFAECFAMKCRLWYTRDKREDDTQ